MTFLYKVKGSDVYATGCTEEQAREAIRAAHCLPVSELELLAVATATDDVFCCPTVAGELAAGRISL